MEEHQQGWGETKIFLRIWLVVLHSLCYSYFLVSKLPKGKLRLFALLPIFYLFITLPLSLSAPLLAGTCGFFFTWLANFKLLLFAFNQGPLSHKPPISLSEFLLTSALPVKIRSKTPKYPSKLAHHQDQVLPLNLPSKTIIILALSYLSSQNLQYVPANSTLVIYGFMIYLLLDIGLGLCNNFVGSILGADLYPPFNEPYLSTSLTDFWGRRWNLMVNDTLRQTIYIPISSFCSIRLKMGWTWARCIGIMSSFLVSGLIHELIFYYMARVRPTWEVTGFFVLHGVCVMLEVVLKRAFGKRLRLWWVFSGPLTVGFVLFTTFWLFFPPLMRNGVHVKSTEDVGGLILYFKGMTVDVIEKIK